VDQKQVKLASAALRDTPSALRLGSLGEFILSNGTKFCEHDIIHKTSGFPFAALCPTDSSIFGLVGDITSGGESSFVYSGTPQLP
jgi:hypothetical protein